MQPDGKVGFEFEAKDPTKARGARGRAGGALRVLGAHPKTKAPVELHAGRYGPYVKHGAVNATLPDREQVDTLTLDEALALLAAKSGKGDGAPARTAKGASPKKKRAKASAAATPVAEAAPRSRRPRARRP